MKRSRYRLYYPYAKWTHCEDITEEEKYDVLISFIKGLIKDDLMNKWIKPEEWEKSTFSIIKIEFKDKYRARNVLRNDINRLKSCLYANIDKMVSLGVIDIDPGTGFEYPKFKFGLVNMWKLFVVNGLQWQRYLID